MRKILTITAEVAISLLIIKEIGLLTGILMLCVMLSCNDD